MTNHSNLSLKNEELKLILQFEKNLEQLFMTETKVVICPSKESVIKLAIEVDFNFSFPEIVSIIKMALLKDNRPNQIQNLVLQFKISLIKLSRSINTNLDIEEFSMYFKNTSIIINSIENNSIIEELNSTLHAILYHFEFYTTVMGSVPNEIHIPVLEDTKTKKLFNLKELVKLPTYTSPYAQFWGLYFDYLDKPLIYNLNRTNIIPGDLDVSLD